MPTFKKTPRQQRAEARLRRMSPEERAVLSSLNLDEVFADKEMRKRVRSMQLGTQKEARTKGLELGERGLKLKEREFKFQKKQIGPATLIGAGQVALGVYGGMQERKTAQELARAALSQQRQYTEATPPVQEPWRRWKPGQPYGPR